MVNKGWKKEISLTPRASILDAMKIINLFPQLRTVLIVEDNKLIAIATEGDIRRGILNALNTSDGIMEIANKNPITIQRERPKLFFEH